MSEHRHSWRPMLGGYRYECRFCLTVGRRVGGEIRAHADKGKILRDEEAHGHARDIEAVAAERRHERERREESGHVAAEVARALLTLALIAAASFLLAMGVG